MKRNGTPQKVKLTVEQIEAALKAAAGNISYAARALNVGRTTLYRRIEASPTLQEYLVDTREELVDIAESALKREVLNQNITAIIFTLKTQGKSRGYVERVEHMVFDAEQLKRFEVIAAKLGKSVSEVFEDMVNVLGAELSAEIDAGGAADSAEGESQ